MTKYRKVAPVFLKRVAEDMTVDTLEGKATVKADEDYLAKGVQGEMWPIPIETVKDNYTDLGLPPTSDGFYRYRSNREVTAELLTEDSQINGMVGNAGKDYRVSDGSESWFVKKDIFEETYEESK